MTREEVLDELKGLAKKIDPKIITDKDVREIPKLTHYIRKHFKKLGLALRAAGLPSSRLASSMSVTSEELLDYLEELQKKIGSNRLTISEVTHDDEVYKKYSSHPFSWTIFKKRFGGFPKILEELSLRTQDVKSQKKSIEPLAIKQETEHDYNKRTFLGKAAEFHVTAELIYRGFQAGGIPIDEGLDLLAVKNNKVFYFQVKHKDLKNSALVKITKSSYEKTGGGSVYFIFVLLLGEQRKFLIVPYHTFNDWKEDGWFSEEEKHYLLKIREDNENFVLLNKAGNKLYIDRFIDQWDRIR